MNYPNKIFTLEYSGDSPIEGTAHLVIVIAASSSEVAKQYVKDRIGIEVEPMRLQNAVYPTIYDQTGRLTLPVQVKILSNSSFYTH